MMEYQDLSAFPYKPYSNQTDFMKALHRSLMFENNTWTGESLSIISGALQWLIHHKDKIQAKERVSQVFSDAGEGSLRTHIAGSKDQGFLLQDYESQEESSLVRRKPVGGFEISSKDEEECSDHKQGLKVIFRSRTDSSWFTGIIYINERFLRAAGDSILQNPPDGMKNYRSQVFVKRQRDDSIAKTRGRHLLWLPSSETDVNSLNSEELSSDTQSDDSNDEGLAKLHGIRSGYVEAKR